jgi:hypothetical protein
VADNVQITPGLGVIVSTDEVGGVQVQRVKVQHGADGTASDVTSTNPLPVLKKRTDTAATPGTSANVDSAASSVVLAANAARIECTLVNDSDVEIYLRLASSGATVGSGIRLNRDGGSYSTDAYTGAISARAASGSAKRLLITEV